MAHVDPSLFDIEDISEVIRLRSDWQGAPMTGPSRDDCVPETDNEDSLPVLVPEGGLQPRDSSIDIIDTLTKQKHDALRSDVGPRLRYRIGVLGIGKAVEDIYAALCGALGPAQDILLEDPPLRALYSIGLFGGHPRGDIDRTHVDHLVDRLALFRPNLLVVVNAGQVKKSFADKNPQQLALLTRYLNQGAMRGSQRPYGLVFVVNRLTAEKAFSIYMRSCQMMNTPPAMMQFLPEEISDLIDYARFELRNYTRYHLQIKVLKQR